MTLTEPAAAAAVSATEAVAGQVRAELARLKVTGRELARRTGKDYAYWWRRLNGEVPMTVTDLAVVSGILEVPVATLVSPLDGMSGGRPPIGRYGDTPGHDTPSAWELAA